MSSKCKPIRCSCKQTVKGFTHANTARDDPPRAEQDVNTQTKRLDNYLSKSVNQLVGFTLMSFIMYLTPRLAIP